MFLKLLKKLPTEDVEFILKNVLKSKYSKKTDIHLVLQQKINSMKVRRYILFFSKLRGIIPQRFWLFKKPNRASVRNILSILDAVNIDISTIVRKIDGGVSKAWFFSSKKLSNNLAWIRDGLILRYGNREKSYTLLFTTNNLNGRITDELMQAGFSLQKFPPYIMRKLLSEKLRFTRLVFLTRSDVMGVSGIERIILEGDNVVEGFYEFTKRQDRLREITLLMGPVIEIEIDTGVSISNSGDIEVFSLNSLFRILPTLRRVIDIQ